MSPSSTGSQSNTAAQLWRDLRAYLEYERAEGRDRISVSTAAALNLKRWIHGMQTHSHPDPAPIAQAPSRSNTRPMSSDGTVPPDPRRAAGNDPAARLKTIACDIDSCKRCKLAATRNRTVPGHGNPQPDLLFVGEAPGEQEDRQGLPFVGRSGALLTRMINNLGLSREEVYIANILKCRPPGNRTPTPRERETCLPYLEAQIDILRPKVIVALGATALRGLLGSDKELSGNRGIWLEYRGIPLMTTYHPSYLLRNPKARFTTWDDMLKVLNRLGRRPPSASESHPVKQ